MASSAWKLRRARAPRLDNQLPPPARPPLDLMARVLLAIWVGGTATYTLGLVLIPPPEGAGTVLWSVSVTAVAITAILWAGRRRLPSWTPDASGAACFVLASAVVAGSRDAHTPAALFYLWVIVTSCYFVPPARAAAQVAAVAVGYSLALALCPQPFPWDHWALLSLTAVTVGGTVATLRARELSLVEQLDRAARTDALTGLLNRRGFDETLGLELLRADRSGSPMALIIADLDHFKAVNDLLGHTGGDVVLRRTAADLASAVRLVDHAARLGGEEFAVICPGCGPTDAHDLAERVRAGIAGHLGIDTRITVSLGVAIYPYDASDASSLFQEADDACYRAKRQGRDQTVMATPVPSRPSGGPTPQSTGAARPQTS